MKSPVRSPNGEFAFSTVLLSLILISSIFNNMNMVGVTGGFEPDQATRNGGVLVDRVDLPTTFPDLEPRYVILCPVQFKEEVIPLAVQRTRMGLPSSVYTIESIESAYDGLDREQKVHNFLRSMHQKYPTFRWLLIVGDAEHLMPRALWHYALDRGQPFENFYYSDVYYAGLDHDWDTDGDGRYGEYSVQGVVDGDTDWDLMVGRIPASSEAHASNYINKLMRYERNPPVGSWMERFLNWGSLMEPPNRDFEPNRYWDHKSNAYKVCKRVEENLPQDIELKSLYDYPQLEGGNYTVGDGRDTLHRSNMLSEFNAGASMLNFAGQARYEAYALNDYGPPTGNGTSWRWNEPMSYSDHSLFTNGDMMPFMYASTCDTAKFFDQGAYNDMSLETWLTSASGGIIGLISSTGTSARGEETTISWGNWYLDEEFWKLFFTSGESRPGRTLFTLKEQYENKWLSPTMEIKETILGMLYAYILLGDPWVDIYTAPAKRFMIDTAIVTDFYTGEHSVRFQVLDRDLVPVNEPTVTIYNDEVYIVLKGDSSGWVNESIDLGASTEINVTFTGHNMVPAFYSYDVIPAVSDISLSGEYTIDPMDYSLQETIDIEVEVKNRGGLVAEDVVLHVIYNGGNGDASGHYTSVDIGDVDPGTGHLAGFQWTVRPGNHSFSLLVDSSSEEIDPHNNELEIAFDTPGPRFLFNQGSGIIRPSSLSSPGSPISMDFNILNAGPVPGSIDVQLFNGNPQTNGTPLSDVISIERIGVDQFGNGSIEFTTPGSDSLLYLMMDPLDRYPSEFIDEPKRSLLEVNYPPRWTGEPTMSILEDSSDNELRLDPFVSDDDDQLEDLVFQITDVTDLTAKIQEGTEGEVFLVCDPIPDRYGSGSVTISVSDGLNMDTVTVNVTVISVNDDPFFTDAVQGLIELSVLEDEELSFRLRADDIDSDALTFEHFGTKIVLDQVSGVVTWSPTQEDVGTNDFTILVKDADGGKSALTLRITVIGVDDPPLVQPVPDTVLEVGEFKTVQLTVKDEEGTPLTYGSNTSLVWVDEDGLVHINGSSEHLGLNMVRISISDGLNTVYVFFNITVNGDPEVSDTSDNGEQLQYALGAAGIALAVIALLFLGLIFLKRTGIDQEVMEEMEEADEMYHDEMDALEDEYADE